MFVSVVYRVFFVRRLGQDFAKMVELVRCQLS